MAKVSNVLKYLVARLQDKSDKNDPKGIPEKDLRLALYLCDWKYAIDNNGKTILADHWIKEKGEPQWKNLHNILDNNKNKYFIVSDNKEDDSKFVIFLAEDIDKSSLEKSIDENVMRSISKVLQDYYAYGPDKFEEIALSTYPLFAWSPDNKPLDLKKISSEYNSYVRQRPITTSH